MIIPDDSDVLCGRGAGVNHHAGNVCWRALIAANKRLYVSMPYMSKGVVARSIVHAVRSVGGRFLQRDARTDGWNDIGDRKATEKTSQALREGQAEIRRAEVEAVPSLAGMSSAAVFRRDFSEHFLKNSNTSAGGGVPRPGQILPNGLITLECEGVMAAVDRKAGLMASNSMKTAMRRMAQQITMQVRGQSLQQPAYPGMQTQAVQLSLLEEARTGARSDAMKTDGDGGDGTDAADFDVSASASQATAGSSRRGEATKTETKKRATKAEEGALPRKRPAGRTEADAKKKRARKSEGDAEAKERARVEAVWAARREMEGEIRERIIVEDGKVYNCNQWYEV